MVFAMPLMPPSARELNRTDHLLQMRGKRGLSPICLGNARFAAEIAAALNRRVTPGKPGRPRNTPQALSGDLFDDKQ
jgi:hypothetical protein